MIGALLGLATSVGSSIYGGIKAHQADKAYKKEMNNLKKQQNDWYTARYNADYTQRADVQNMLSRAKEQAVNLIKGAAGTNAVMGGTDDMMNNAYAQAGNMLANTNANIAAQAGQYKDAVDGQHQQDVANQAQMAMNYQAQSAANSQNAASQGMKAGMGLVQSDAQYLTNTKGKDLFMDLFKSYKKNV